MYRGKFREMVMERIRAELWAMYGKEKIAPRPWHEGKGLKWLEGEGMPTQPRTISESGNRSRK